MSQQVLSFDDYANENGARYWWASDLMSMLDINDTKAANKMIDRAIKACMSAGIEWMQEFRQVETGPDGTGNWKLTRFACYMTVMSGNNANPAIAHAQVYFASMTQAAELKRAEEEIERLVIRQDLSEGQKSLSSTVKKHGVVDFAKFQNAGYRGMYNMYNSQLAKRRNIPREKLLEHMGRTELAANLFRVTMTEEKIKNEDLFGQQALEQAHENVSRQVRKMVKENTGVNPEDMPQEKVLPEVRKSFKKTSRDLKKIDTSGKPKTNGDDGNNS